MKITTNSNDLSTSVADQIAALRETNKALIKALEACWENKCFLPIKERHIVEEALRRAKG